MGNLSFTFNGATTSVPGVLVSTTIGQQAVLSLLPFGRVMMIGASDGGKGGGTVYTFPDLPTASQVLRGGQLLNALTDATSIGQASGIVAVVVGTKTSASASLGAGAATLTAGDQGTWTNQIAYSYVAGTNTGTAWTISYPAPNGQTLMVGGKGSNLDNIVTWTQLQAAILANAVLTPPASSGFPAIVALSITTPGNIPTTPVTTTYLTGGTGNGEMSLVFNDFKPGIDALADVPYDLGHPVACYLSTVWAYMEAQAAELEVYGYLRRNFYQAQITGLSAANTKAQNSLALSQGLAADAIALNSKRANIMGQQLFSLDQATGVYTFRDAAPFYVGLAALLGATGQAGPSTPLTNQPLAICADVDYPVLQNTGDLDYAINNGCVIFQRQGDAQPGAVSPVRSVTTAPSDANGNPWIFAEFSMLRGADAVLANVKAQVQTSIGQGATKAVLTAVLAEVQDILELALDAGIITNYDSSSLSISPSAQAYPTGTGYIINYSCSPTPPLNFLGVAQLLVPFQTSVSVGGQVSG